MKLKLEPLRTPGLSHMEAGQLINRHLSDLATIDQALLTDVPFNTYINALGSQLEVYMQGLAQVQKNEETEKIVLADSVRDKAVSAFGTAIKLHLLSDIPEEVEASRSLSILFGTYKNLATLNYEAESLGIDKLTGELNSPAYSEKINLLHMSKYVARMSEANATFKTLFSGRMVGNALTESYDMKVLRADLFNKYSDFAEYVLSMAKSTENTLFPTALNLLNTGRKYYSDLLARRATPKPEEAKPSLN
ncbi:MAG: DUF6261 family protein [Mariniphaga sp.]